MDFKGFNPRIDLRTKSYFMSMFFHLRVINFWKFRFSYLSSYQMFLELKFYPSSKFMYSYEEIFKFLFFSYSFTNYFSYYQHFMCFLIKEKNQKHFNFQTQVLKFFHNGHFLLKDKIQIELNFFDSFSKFRYVLLFVWFLN